MSRIILPGNPDREGRLEILVPSGHERPIAFRCRVPIDAEQTCGKPFYENERAAFERHVGECARENADAIHAASPRTRMPWSDPENWSPEAEAHLREVGKRMLEEGRLEMKPNERIHNE